MINLGRALLILALAIAVSTLCCCVGDVEVRSDGNMTCVAPRYDVVAFSCGFDFRCNTIDALPIAESDWECRCNVVPKENPDLRLECVLTSSRSHPGPT